MSDGISCFYEPITLFFLQINIKQRQQLLYRLRMTFKTKKNESFSRRNIRKSNYMKQIVVDHCSQRFDENSPTFD